MAKTSETQTQKELREPDAFQKASAPVAEWLITHQRTLTALAGLVVLGLLGVSVGSTFSQRGETQAAQAFGRALEVLERPLEGEFNPSANPDKPAFKTARERDEALREALTTFRKEHGGTPAALTAALPLAQAEARLGNHDAALALYDAFLDMAGKSDPLRASALEGRGYALEAQGRLDEALAAFDALSQLKQEQFLSGMGAYHRARILLQQQKQDEGVKALQEVVASHPNTAASRLAGERLQVLSSQGVAIPQAPASQAPAKTEASGG